MLIVIFEYVEKRFKAAAGDGPGSALTNCFFGCIRCCLNCCHRFIKFLNKNAYAQVALTSKNFCTSAINAFTLILRNAATFAITSGLGTIFIFLGKLTITVCNTFVCYEIMIHWANINDYINSPVGPVIVLVLESYLISAIFMSIFNIACSTLLQCFLTDVEISKGKGHDEAQLRPKEMDDLVEALKKK